MASSTCGLRRVRNSWAKRTELSVARSGTQRARAAAATTPMTTTAQNVARQPNAWPRMVPAGTPSTLASVRPANISEIACARRSRGTRSAATTAPMPKNEPCAQAVNTRDSISRP